MHTLAYIPPVVTTDHRSAAVSPAAGVETPGPAAPTAATIPTQDHARSGDIGKESTTRPAQVTGSQGHGITPRKARRTMQVLTKHDRLKGCGVRLVGGAGGVSVDYAEGANARFNGLQTCKSRWLCPVCAPRVANERAREVAALVQEHVRRGGAVAMATLTIPHFWPDSLEHLMDVTKAAWGRLTSDKAWKGAEGIRARYGVTLPPVWALEVTHGSQGWHPHRHVLLFLDKALSSSALEALEAELFEVWARVVVKAGGRRPSSSQGVDVRQAAQVEAAAALGAYAVKGDTMNAGDVEGVADEVMRGAMKQARKGGRTPLQILSDISAAYEAGETAAPLDTHLWKEWETYHMGDEDEDKLGHVTRQVQVPKALKEALEVEEEADEAAAVNEDVVDGKRLEWTAMVIIPAWAWRKHLARDLELQDELLAAARSVDIGSARRGVVEVLERVGVDYIATDRGVSRGPDKRAWRTDIAGARAVL